MCILTILRLKISMKNSHSSSWSLGRRSDGALCEAQHVGANVWGVNTIVTAIQSKDQLAKDAPNKAFLGSLALKLQVLDDSTKVSVATVFHVQVQVLARLEVFAVVVGDDVGVSQVGKDLELGVKLLAFLLGHSKIRNLFAAHDEAVRLAADLANDSKGAMAYE